MNKLVLGTVQFGLNYGINNFRGALPEKEVFEILKWASQHDINTLDTSYAYGESECVIGRYIKKNEAYFKIISKLPRHTFKDSHEVLKNSLNNLNIHSLYGYLIHHFDFFLEKPQVWEEINQIKADGKIEKIGFSLYYPAELEYLLEKNISFDILQIPYSIFDQRFSSYFFKLKEMNVEIYVRSVFLQGLIFKELKKLSQRFFKIKPNLDIINRLSFELNIPVSAIYLNFAMLNPSIDGVVIGVDSKEHLIENIVNIKEMKKINQIYDTLKELREDDENIVLPVNWK
ncbi:MAG: aldo/keto reductase [Candidatus Eremiobacterota bacterium]